MGTPGGSSSVGFISLRCDLILAGDRSKEQAKKWHPKNRENQVLSHLLFEHLLVSGAQNVKKARC